MANEEKSKSERKVAEATEVIGSVPQLDVLPARVDLRELFPQSVRLAFVESFAYVIIMVILCLAYIWYAMSIPTALISTPLIIAVDQLVQIVFYSGLTVCSIKLLYELLCFLLYRYGIELEHLTIVRGLIYRSRASFPIAKINDVSLQRTPIEILFGMHTITILTASPTALHGSIQGLPAKSAYGLQTYLLALVETTLPDVKEKTAERMVERAAQGPVTAAL